MNLIPLYGLVVGLALGLTGGGGSIFAVPLLMYAVGLSLTESVTVSLAVVGLTAIFGAALQRHLVRWRAGVVLGMGGIAGAPVGSALHHYLSESLTLILFSILMIFIGVNMWRTRGVTDVPIGALACRRGTDGEIQFHWNCALKLLLAGALTGVLSSLFGVGGGFLIVPSLLLVTGLSIEKVMATSLVAIAIISGAAFISNHVNHASFPLPIALRFLVGTGFGMGAGILLKKHIPSLFLKRLFAVAMIGVALWMLTRTFLIG